MNQFEYDVALSFAGEDRDQAAELAGLLKERGIRIFYDRDQETELWGTNLADHLPRIYSEQARFCLILISRHYVAKRWTNLERQHAQARAMKDDDVYILPVRLDDTELPGLPDTVMFLDGQNLSPEQIANQVARKLETADETPEAVTGSKSSASIPDIPMPQVRREFTDRDRAKIARESFEHIRTYFEDGSRALPGHDAEVEAEIENVTDSKFIATVYLRGELRHRMKIWVGGCVTSSDRTQICYAEGRSFSTDEDNSMNGWATLEDDGFTLEMKLDQFSGGSFGAQPGEIRGKEAIAEALWRRFTAPLER